VDATKGIWLRFVEARLLGLAAQMAFWLFLALIPLAAVGVLSLRESRSRDRAELNAGPRTTRAATSAR
jgi:uncharacterized BrkB/YihY/UPF0761 family membrane protein